jgi:5-methyltetrahydrofolate--homocysteine methyltransferase
MSRLVEALHSGRVLVMDGAMGTELQRLGLREGESPELWNLTHPERVASVHRAYLEAGAEVLLTNTFQANPEALARHGLRDRMAEIWQSAMESARLFTDPAPLVLADIGPFESMDHSEQRALLDLARSADGLLLETWTLLPAGRTYFAICGQNRIGTGPRLPLLLSFTYGREDGPHGRFAGALTAAVAADTLEVTALGANCGAEIDMDDLLTIVRIYRQNTDLPLFIRPNAGTPRRTASGWEYPRSPEYMADKLWPLLEAGVTMVGGCCGTTPAHIAALRRVVDEWNANV